MLKMFCPRRYKDENKDNESLVTMEAQRSTLKMCSSLYNAIRINDPQQKISTVNHGPSLF